MLPRPGPIALAAVEGAEENVGAQEQGHNSGPWVNAYLASVGLKGSEAPWCMAFVFYRLWKAAGQPADYELPNGFPRTGYTPTVASWAKAHGVWIPIADAERWRTTVLRGDLAMFWFSGAGRIAHVGIVAAACANGVVTVEGNTGPGPGVEREGDGVYRRHRAWHELGAHGGFVRLGW